MQYRWTIALWLILCTALAGCAASAPSRFYTFGSLSDSQQAIPADAGVGHTILGIGPVDIPAYLDRPQIVTRVGPYELQLAEFHHWAEPLGDTVMRTLAANVSHLLAGEAVVVVPWKRAKIDTDYQVILDVQRLDGTVGDAALLVAQWCIFDQNGKNRVPVQTSRIRESTQGTDIRSLVAAQSRALAKLGSRIADAARTVIHP